TKICVHWRSSAARSISGIRHLGPLPSSRFASAFLGVQRRVLIAVVRPVVEALGGRPLQAIAEFDVGALVDRVRGEGGEVGNEKPPRTAGLFRQRLAVEPIDHKSLVDDRSQRNAGMKIVPRGMQTYP